MEAQSPEKIFLLKQSEEERIIVLVIHEEF